MFDPITCKFLSLNVRGLKNKKKRRSIFTYLKDQKCHFYFLQESYIRNLKTKLFRKVNGQEKFCSRMAETEKRASAF